MTDLDWGDFKIILALAQAGSVRRAAGLLGVHPSTVTRRIDAVERSLGTRLFRRQPSGLSPTLAGRELLESAERIQTEVHRMERRLSGRDDKLEGPVRITLPDAVGLSFLMDDLARFAAENPQVQLNVVPSYGAPDLGAGETDIAVQATEDPPENLVGRPLGRFAVAAYATPEYLARHDPHRKPEKCRRIGWDDGSGNEASFASDFENVPVGSSFASVVLQQAAAHRGFGIADLPCALGDSDPRLVRVPPGTVHEGASLWLFTHPDLRGSARIRAVMDVISGSFREHADLVSGVLEREPQAA